MPRRDTGDEDLLNVIRVLDTISPSNLGRLALELGIPQSKIDEFHHDEKYYQDKKTKVVDFWLKNVDNRSWKELQRALYAINERKAGDQIESDYLVKLWKDPRVQHYY